MRWSVVLGTIALVVGIAVSRWGTLADTRLTLSLPWVLPATLVAAAANIVLALGWRQLLVAYGSTLGAARSIRTWALSQATRYLPSGLVPVVARASLAAPDAVPRSVGAVSVVVETAALLGWVALACALWAPGDWIHPVFRVLLGLAALTGLATLPFTLAGVRLRCHSEKRGAGLTSKLLGLFSAGARLHTALADRLLQANRSGVYKAVGVFGGAVAARLAAAALLAAAVLPVGAVASTASRATGIAADVWLVVGAVAVATLVGMIGITPAGLGVRETLLATLLTARFGFGDALAYSVVLRAWEIALELVFLAVAAYFGRRSRPTPKTPDTLKTPDTRP